MVAVTVGVVLAISPCSQSPRHEGVCSSGDTDAGVGLCWQLPFLPGVHARGDADTCIRLCIHRQTMSAASPACSCHTSDHARCQSRTQGFAHMSTHPLWVGHSPKWASVQGETKALELRQAGGADMLGPEEVVSWERVWALRRRIYIFTCWVYACAKVNPNELLHLILDFMLLFHSFYYSDLLPWISTFPIFSSILLSIIFAFIHDAALHIYFCFEPTCMHRHFGRNW